MALLTQTFSAILFDMDGTLIDSTPAVEAAWTRWAVAHTIPPLELLASSHGCRTIDVMRKWRPEVATLEEVSRFEAGIPGGGAGDVVVVGEGAVAAAAGAKELPGARRLVEGIVAGEGKWAVVTSGTGVLVSAWVKILNLPTPPSLVTADLVVHGKPSPEGYLLARTQLGIPPTTTATTTTTTTTPYPTLVVEDAPAGIRAGKSAGCLVLALLTTHTREQVLAAGADYIARDLGDVEFVKVAPGGAGEVTVRMLVEVVGGAEVGGRGKTEVDAEVEVEAAVVETGVEVEPVVG